MNIHSTPSMAIAPIGDVKLNDPKNKSFDFWGPDSVAVVVVSDVKGTTRAIVTSLSTANAEDNDKSFADVKARYLPGQVLRFRGDQTGREYKGLYTVTNVFRHTPEGHTEISKALKRKSLWFATFK